MTTEGMLLRPMEVTLCDDLCCPKCSYPTLVTVEKKKGKQVYMCVSCFSRTVIPIPVDTSKFPRTGWLVNRGEESGFVEPEKESKMKPASARKWGQFA